MRRRWSVLGAVFASLVVLAACGCSLIEPFNGYAGSDGGSAPRDASPTDSSYVDALRYDSGAPKADGAPMDAIAPADATVDTTVQDTSEGQDTLVSCAESLPFTPTPWAPPTAFGTPACTDQTIFGVASEFEVGGSPASTGSTACDQCLFADVTASEHGPILTDNGVIVELNVGGCVDDTLGGSQGLSLCGATVQAADDCFTWECGGCGGFGLPPMPNGPAATCEADVFGSNGPCAAYPITPTCQGAVNASQGTCVDVSVSDFLLGWCGGAVVVDAGSDGASDGSSDGSSDAADARRD